MANISLEEAKAMMTQSSLDKLKDIVTVKPTINMDKKTSNDIIMQALCKAVTENVIHESSLNNKIVKLLNAETNSVSQTKLGEILLCVRKSQPDMACVISLMNQDMSETLQKWTFTGPTVFFNGIFEYVIDAFEITPGMVRDKLSQLLKPTIANNIAQLLSRYELARNSNHDEHPDIPVSITTITRLVNMANHILIAEFKEV